MDAFGLLQQVGAVWPGEGRRLRMKWVLRRTPAPWLAPAAGTPRPRPSLLSVSLLGLTRPARAFAG